MSEYQRGYEEGYVVGHADGHLSAIDRLILALRELRREYPESKVALVPFRGDAT